MNKIKRHKIIKDIVAQDKIASQRELQKKLEKRGFKTTQATLSRDLNSLRIIKIPDRKKGHVYALPDRVHRTNNSIMTKFPVESFHSISFSDNIAILKCTASFAPNIAMLIDEMEMNHVLGTIAGEDTVMIVLQEGVSKNKFMDTLVQQVPELENHI
ncbi:MAG: ArgR family transcriptional regulator [Candidatus Marinimicrobia bacterium]|nr:ArgR family transcriptional regulator [Candidatus Neomarinimicrobiota bacterium]